MKRLYHRGTRRSKRIPLDRSGAAPARLLPAAVCGAIVAAVVSTVAQVMLWLAFTDAFPEILYRDARMAAAIVLGDAALGSAGFDAGIMIVASLVHFALSLIYAVLFCALTRPFGASVAIIGGGVLGALLFLVNLYGFTAVFPWFVAARDWITFAAHVVFGVACVAGCRWMTKAARLAD